MRKKSLRSIIMIGLMTMILMLPLNAMAASASKGSDVPPPPPVEDSQTQVLNGNNKYLQDGWNSIQDNGNGNITVSCTTTAWQVVAEIGCTMYLQKYSNSQWVTISTGGSSDAWESMFSIYADKTVTKGYYYRVQTVHYVSHNGVFEQGTTVGPYKYIP